jgi:probable HAF family extracellular repeat protein
MRAQRPLAFLAPVGALLALLLAGCGGETISPAEPAARAAASGGGGPGVKSTVPDSAPRNTRLTVRVLGSGFDQGSRAVWALAGDTTFATTKILTNSTTFVSSTELRADISIGADAPLANYDVVAVTSRGKKGIGIELFTVTYERVDLGTLGGTTSSAQSISDAGQITGTSTTASGAQHVFVWTDGVMQDLGPGWPWAINSQGVVTGNVEGRAVVWLPKTGGGYNPPSNLPALGGSPSSGKAINDGGQIAGEGAISSGASHAYLVTGTVVTDIHTVAGGNSFPWGMNSLGHVAGQWDGPTNQLAFVWTATSGMRLLPTLGGTGGVALDVNDADQVVGWSESAPGKPWEAFLYENGAVRSLGTLGAPGSVAMAINRFGVIVGRASTGFAKRSTQHPFIWTAADGMKDLGVPKGSSSGQAWDINAFGAIAGEVQVNSSSTHATLWRLH